MVTITPELLASIRGHATTYLAYAREQTVLASQFLEAGYWRDARLHPAVVIALLDRIEALDVALRTMSPEAHAIALKHEARRRRSSDEDLRNGGDR